MAISETSAWVGRRIKEARESSGQTQGDLADLLGISQTAISYWEAGKRAPGLDDIVRLANALQREPSYFFPETATRSNVRALLRATAQQLDRQDLDTALQRLLDDAEALDPPDRVIEVVSSRPQRAAREVLVQAAVNSPPVDVETLAKLCGAAVLRKTFDDALSGVLVAFAGWAAIGVNKKHSSVRQRFTIAHELGHYVLSHHDHFHIDLGPTDAHGHPPGYDWQSERGANDFAAELLMPSDFVRPAFEKSPFVSALAQLFEVSELAMGYRLLNLGLR